MADTPSTRHSTRTAVPSKNVLLVIAKCQHSLPAPHSKYRFEMADYVYILRLPDTRLTKQAVLHLGLNTVTGKPRPGSILMNTPAHSDLHHITEINLKPHTQNPPHTRTRSALTVRLEGEMFMIFYFDHSHEKVLSLTCILCCQLENRSQNKLEVDILNHPSN